MEKGANNAKCTVLGDIKLDLKKWETPEPLHVNMIDKKEEDGNRVRRFHTAGQRSHKILELSRAFPVRPNLDEFAR